MTRSLSSAKLLSALAADAMSSAFARRGYSAATQGATAQMAKAGGATRSGAAAEEKTGEEEKMVSSDGQVSWAPDPRTGCYRPDNCIEEIDVAELRAKHLWQKE
ncbi:protein SENESCENCE-ASSOCIATED GENE 21, mitochondrial-like [Eucalyptus grandis]|uniref:protein SENESCENCE-ASSOCIATED GENE 21, mitochondrial-like n=1 Tax=Eucalyptus grandis TaxID=71139 RepID=UPI0008A0DF9F|nr:protein SENESCENCE-ASSOCIATED GENE 21, mitochondrial-like [Eucalyptus grandis]